MSDEPRRIATSAVADTGRSEAAREAWGDALGAALRARALELAEQVTAESRDAVEAALASALERAAAAGQWATVEALARELEARRRARGGVLDLEAARSRRRK